MPYLLDPGSALGELDLGWAQLGSIEPANWAPLGYIHLKATVGGTDLRTLCKVISARCSFGWDKPVSEARITIDARPDGLDYGQQVIVEAGRGANNCVRFVGIVRDWDYSNWPRSVTIVAQSELCLLEDRLPKSADINEEPDEGQPGIDLQTLLGAESGTLRQIVTAVLTYCGVTLPRFIYDPPHVYGLVGPENFTWRTKESAMAYLHRLFAATAGARLFSSGDGNHYVAQIVGRPRDGTTALALVEGLDILPGATTTRSIRMTRNAVRVSGYDDGANDPPGPLMVESISANPFMSAGDPHFFEVSSDLIEDEAFAQHLADTYWLTEVNREITNVQLSTWRDDVQGPAQSHWILSQRTGVTEAGWVLASDLNVDARSFTIANKYVCGGVKDAGAEVPI